MATRKPRHRNQRAPAPALRGTELAQPGQLYSDPQDAPRGAALAHPTQAAARAAARYWLSPHPYYAERPLESTFLFPSAVGLAELLERAEVPFPPAEPLARAPRASPALLPEHRAAVAAARAQTAAWRALSTAERPAARRALLEHAMRVVGSGVYVRIEAGQVVRFLPFTSWEFEGEWEALPCAGGSPAEFAAAWARRQNRPAAAFHADSRRWTPGSGELLGLEDWTGQTVNSRCPELLYLLWLTLSQHPVPDCEFLFNRRDTPQLRADGRHPHPHLVGAGMALRRPLPAAHPPVLSQCGSPEHADLLVPTQDDVLLGTGLAFVHGREPVARPRVDWATARPCAVFRGVATGAGTAAEGPGANQRLALARLGAAHRQGGGRLLDAGVVSYNARPRKAAGAPAAVADPRRLPRLVPFLTPAQQTRFRYQVVVDGHSLAFRLPALMLAGHLVLWVASPRQFAAWWSALLRPREHYVPVADVGAVLGAAEWCRAHDAEARAIAARGQALMRALFPKRPGADPHCRAAYQCAYQCAYLAALLTATAPAAKNDYSDAPQRVN